MFANRFGINTSPDTLRPHPDTQRHSPDTPRQKRFYVIRGTCPQYSALYYIKMPMSGGVWIVSEGVWIESECVWGGIDTKSVGKQIILGHDTQTLSFIRVHIHFLILIL